MVRLEAFLVIPEWMYLFLLLSGWLAAMFTGIAFAYGIQMRRGSRVIAFWGVFFVGSLLLIFLLMRGFIAAA